MSTETSIDELLDQEQEALEAKREKWNRQRSILLPIIKAFKSLGAAPRFDFRDSLDIALSGDKHLLAGAVRALRTRGFKSDSDPPGKKDSSWSTFFYNGDVWEDDTIKIWLSFSSTVCRRVKVGTKVETVDVYETVCDELMLPEEHAA